MKANDFNPQSPGKLVATTFTDRVWHQDKWQTTESQGLAFVPCPLPPTIDFQSILYELYPQIVDAERALSLLEGTARRLPNPHFLIGTFSRREAIRSSAIENTFASAEEIAIFDHDPSAVQNRDDVREVANYVSALEHGLASDLPICRRLILEMHSILLEHGIQPGKFRQTQNAIGHSRSFDTAKFVPPPANHVNKLIDNLEKYINQNDKHTPRLLRFAIAHYQFEAIHPFSDGNGRLGRLLITLMLCKHGQLTRPLVYISSYFEEHKDRYMKLLYEISAQNHWHAWFNFFLDAIVSQADDAIHRADKLLELQTDYHKRVQAKRAPVNLFRLIDRLFEAPSVTAAQAASFLGCTIPPAQNIINRLIEKKILIEATDRKHKRIYVAPGVLDLIMK